MLRDARLTGGPRLEISRDVENTEGALQKDGLWLAVVNHGLSNHGTRFVEICYSVDPTERPVRPLLRLCFSEGRFQEVVMPAPTDGCGKWFGRLGPGWVKLLINPSTGGVGSFRLESLRPLTLRQLATRLLRNPKRSFYALAAQLVGLEEESALNWRWALGGEPRSVYRSWRAERQAMPSHRSITDSHEGFDLLFDVRRATVFDIEASCQAVQRQSHKKWRVSFLGTPADDAANQCLHSWMQGKHAP